jgi:hypothetical protein
VPDRAYLEQIPDTNDPTSEDTMSEFNGNPALAKMLRTMTQEQIREFWKAEQIRKRAAGEQYHTVLYAEAVGPRENEVVAQIDG